jgi:hypothetical protein
MDPRDGADERRLVLRAVWRERLHVERGMLEALPRAVAARFEHVWQPADLLLDELAPFPTGLLRLWLAAPGGHVLLTQRPSAYAPGAQPYGDGTLEGLCLVSVADLVDDREAAMLALMRMLDHVLGGGAAAGAPFLSDGGGVTEALREVGQRFARIHELGYGHDELGAVTAGDYFARSLWLYTQDPRRLNVLDPQAHRLYRHTIMSEAFWERGG